MWFIVGTKRKIFFLNTAICLGYSLPRIIIGALPKENIASVMLRSGVSFTVDILTHPRRCTLPRPHKKNTATHKRQTAERAGGTHKIQNMLGDRRSTPWRTSSLH